MDVHLHIEIRFPQMYDALKDVFASVKDVQVITKMECFR